VAAVELGIAVICTLGICGCIYMLGFAAGARAARRKETT
jgi:hypothetical protein